jgi:hypothetical protein
MARVHQLINNNGNPASNQFVITDGDKVFFQSYDSVVAMWDKTNRRLFVTGKWDYSVTTRKHFYIFLNDYTYVSGRREDVLRGLEDGSIILVEERILAY